MGHTLVLLLVCLHHLLVCLLAHFTHSFAGGTVNYQMAIYSVFFFILDHIALSLRIVFIVQSFPGDFSYLLETFSLPFPFSFSFSHRWKYIEPSLKTAWKMLGNGLAKGDTFFFLHPNIEEKKGKNRENEKKDSKKKSNKKVLEKWGRNSLFLKATALNTDLFPQ